MPFASLKWVCLTPLLLANLCILMQMKGGAAQSGPSQSTSGQISGHVFRSDTHQPLAKATVVLNPQDQAAGAQRRVARTDAAGAFMLTDLAPAEYGFEVSRTGFVTNYKERRLLHSGEGINNLDFSLAPASVVFGVVTGEDNEPLEGVKVLILRPTYLPGGILQLSERLSAITNDRGAFRMSGLNPGGYYLRAGGPIEPEPGQIGQLLPLEESADHGEQYRETWFPEPATEDGSTPLRVDAGAEINAGRIQLSTEPTWSIKGEIEGDSAGRPRPSEVSCVRDQPFELTFGDAGAIIQPDGSFVMSGLPAGDYTLTASSSENGFENDAGYASVRIVDRNVSARIQLGEAGRVRGTVTAAGTDRSEFKHFQVSIEALSEDRIYVSDIDSKNNFDIQNVPPGTYTFGVLKRQGKENQPYPKNISCSGTDYSSKPITLSVGGVVSECEIALSHGVGSVSGTVKNGKQLQPNVTVVLIPQSRDLRLIPRYTLTAQTDSAGRYEMEEVIPGSYFLFAVTADSEQPWFALSFADAHQSLAMSVEVSAGQNVRSDLTSF